MPGPRGLKGRVAFVLAFAGWAVPLAAQPVGDAPVPDASKAPIEDISIDELLNTPVEVATQTARSLRETPGVVTVVTREEILRSGARDLRDVLQRVPGLWFGIDVAGVEGLGFRGLWGHEGKILLRVDGQEMNENLFSTLQFGNRYPVEQIERVEIIRGPGSVLYSGDAELAVIDVVTRSNADRNGVAASLTYGQYPHDLGRRSVDVAGGHRFANGLDVGGEVSAGQGNRSDGTYRDLEGGEASMRQGGSREDPLFANLSAGWHDLRVRLLVDRYRMTTVDGYDHALSPPLVETFDTVIGDARWTAHPTETLSVTTRLNYKRQLPWRATAPASLLYDKTTQRLLAHGSVSWEIRPKLALLAGIEGWYDTAKLNTPALDSTPFQTSFNGQDQVAYATGSAFAQLLWDNPVANVAAGARFEHHSKAGNSAVPRLALTKVVDRFHAKLLASAAFRAPGIENLNVGRDVLPESTRTYELEAGYQFGEHVFASVNAFDTTITHPIVYTFDEAVGQGYINAPSTGSRGVELEARLRSRRVDGGVNGSFATSAGKNAIPSYTVQDCAGTLSLGAGSCDSPRLLGLPALKAVVWANVELVADVRLDLSAVLVGARFANLPDGHGGARAGELPPGALLNLSLSWRHVGLPGTTLGVGAYNLLNQSVPLAQPYDGGHAPVPGTPRELLVRLGYEFGL